MGGWVQAIAYNCLYTGWVGLNKFLRKIFIHEKNEKSGNFFHQYIKIISQNELTVDHDYFPYIFNFNAMPESSWIQCREIFEEGGYDQNLT